MVDKVKVLIKFKGKPDKALIRGLGGEVSHEFKIVPIIAATLPPQAIQALSKNPKIEYIEPNVTIHVPIEPRRP